MANINLGSSLLWFYCLILCMLLKLQHLTEASQLQLYVVTLCFCVFLNGICILYIEEVYTYIYYSNHLCVNVVECL